MLCQRTLLLVLAMCIMPQESQAQTKTFELADLNGRNGFAIWGAAQGDGSGFAVSRAGDVNRDGFGDVIVGAPSADPTGDASGQSYVIFGGSNVGNTGRIDARDLNGENGFFVDGQPPVDIGDGGLAGRAVGAAGDVNNDGIYDVIIGAHFDFGQAQTYVVFGNEDVGGSGVVGTSDLDGSNGFSLDLTLDPTFDDFYGESVNGIGDVNRDGVDDFAVGSVFGENWYVYFGEASIGAGGAVLATQLDGTNGFRVEADPTGGASSVRISVDGAGDVNGDGIEDLIVGNGLNDAPFGYLIFGDPNLGTGGEIRVDADLIGGNGFELTGEEGIFSVSGAGDVNGDGFHDVVFGRGTGSGLNTAYVVFGMAEFPQSLDVNALDGTNGFVISDSGRPGGNLTAVSDAGDVNGDGFGDLIIGSLGADPGGRDGAGSSYVLFGSGDLGASGELDLGQLAFDGWVLNGISSRDFSGQSVSGAGDVNGDGLDDVIIGSAASPAGRAFAGESYVVFGPIPEPSSATLCVLGLLAASAWRCGRPRKLS